MTTTAEELAVHEIYLVSIPGLKQGKIVFVMAVEAVIVSPVSAVVHHNIRMFLGNDEILIGIKAQRRRFALLMTKVAVKVRQIRSRFDEVRIRLADSCRAEEIGIHEWDRSERGRLAPQTPEKRHRQEGKSH